MKMSDQIVRSANLAKAGVIANSAKFAVGNGRIGSPILAPGAERRHPSRATPTYFIFSALALLLWTLGAPGQVAPCPPVYQILKSFGPADQTGANLNASLIRGTDGLLYGLTQQGGNSGLGTIFKMNLDGTGFTLLRSFSEQDGVYPAAPLIQGPDGTLYGTTTLGGANNSGTIFKLSPNGDGFSVLHSFDGTDGANPYAPVILGQDGWLYGTTVAGGTSDFGTVFQISTDGTVFTSIKSFNDTDGANPRSIIQGSDGALYGTTTGNSDHGNIFTLSTDGTTFNVLKSFTGPEGADPFAGLVQTASGNLYGTTAHGGGAGAGVLFKINTDGTGYTVLHNFGSTAGDGANPSAVLVQGDDGALYGTTQAGGANTAGTAFSLNLDSSGYNVLTSFGSSAADGKVPFASLLQGAPALIYGTTYFGGSSGVGTVFRFVFPIPSVTSVTPASASAGGPDVTITLTGDCFSPSSTVLWNQTPLVTTYVSATELMAVVPADDLALDNQGIGVVPVTVRNPGGGVSNPQAFTILTPNVATAKVQLAGPGAVVTASAPPNAAGQPAVSAQLNNSAGNQPVIVAAASFYSAPSSGTSFALGSSFTDIKVIGATGQDSLVANFYYPASISGEAEARLTLLYFVDGGGWQPVLSSGNTAPTKNTADLTINNIALGGKFTVTFDNTSTPKITELTGTTFAMVIAPPQITSVSPNAAHIGSSVTISGANFSATPANNIVYFGSVRATVTSASSTSLAATAPTGATYAPITVTVGGLTAYAPAPFTVTFNSSGVIDSSSFAPRLDFPAEPGETPAVLIADLDGDGRPDVIMVNHSTRSISVFPNITLATGNISLGPEVDFGTGSPSDGPVAIAVGDLDGDGKLDVAVIEQAIGVVWIYRNKSSGGNIDFDSAVRLSGGCGGGGATIAIADIDGDGKPDIVTVDICGTVNVLLNASTIGLVNFPQLFAFSVGSQNSAVAVADLDGDGKPDVVVTDNGAIHVLRNISSVNGVSFEAPADLNGCSFSKGLAIGDLNRDGKLDVIGSCAGGIPQGGRGTGSAQLIVEQNHIQGGSFAADSFAAISFLPGPFSNPALADIDGDGKPDIAVIEGPALTVIKNITVPGSDTALAPGIAFSVTDGSDSFAIGDLDGDGKPDLVSAHVNSGVISVYRNTVAPCSPLAIISVASLDGQTIDVCFNQTVEPQSAQNTANYFVNGGAVVVTQATLNPDGRSVSLAVSGLPSTPNTGLSVVASGIQNTCTVPSLGGGTADGIVAPTFQILKSFGQSGDAATPNSGLVQASDGTFYGTSVYGGAYGWGTVYKMAPGGSGFMLLKSFSDTDGSRPVGLIQATDSNLYGITWSGGDGLAGIVFRLGTAGDPFNLLWNFHSDQSDGANPYTPLIQGKDGALYGTTDAGGGAGPCRDGGGTVFKINPDGTSYAVIKSFDCSDGHSVTAGLVQGTDNALYGTTYDGGAFKFGTVYRIGTDGTGFMVLKTFTGRPDGAYPFGGLVQGNDGFLYGTTTGGGINGMGTVFRLSADGTYFTVLKSFCLCEGAYPTTALTETADGAFYGTTTAGGAFGFGGIFRVNADGSGFKVVRDFNYLTGFACLGCSFGYQPIPSGRLLQGLDGALYGVTPRGGEVDGGTIFRLAIPVAGILGSLTPSSAQAGGSSFLLTVTGSFFQPGATVLWNGTALATTFVNNSQLVATVPAADLVSSANITTATITVLNPGGLASNPKAFTIVSANVAVAQSQIATAGQTVTVTTAPNLSGQAGVSATLADPVGAAPVSVTAANYSSNPGAGTVFNTGSSFVDLKVSGASASHSLTANFYYPSTVTGTIEANLKLLYLTASGGWNPVLTSGGIAPTKNTSDNLDGTISGGRITVTFDSTSTPKITELTGTAFAMVADMTPPVITCPANIVKTTDPGRCSAVVNYTVTASDNSGSVRLVCTPSSGSVFPKGTTTVNCVATDSSGNQAGCSFTVTVQNPTPTVTITGPASGAVYAIGAVVNFTGTFNDNPGDLHTANWTFDNITAPGTINEAAGSVSASYSFTAAGVYAVNLNVTDVCGNAGSANTVSGLPAMVVVYDPSAAFVTGGGWINSPAGAYVPKPTLTGKASFGFVSKYAKGATVPTGETEFQFQVANFDFHSTNYQWLVVSGARAQYKGTGTVNNAGNYGFILTAIDGDVKGGGGVDKFRIKIWDNSNNGAIVYDNQMGASDSADPTTAIGGGSIVIHAQ